MIPKGLALPLPLPWPWPSPRRSPSPSQGPMAMPMCHIIAHTIWTMSPCTITQYLFVTTYAHDSCTEHCYVQLMNYCYNIIPIVSEILPKYLCDKIVLVTTSLDHPIILIFLVETIDPYLDGMSMVRSRFYESSQQR